jgi:5-methylcytosine-specific restriction protein A
MQEIYMSPTIRIDEDVYAWLQQNARPFEDTPNSVLRRVAGLENSIPIQNSQRPSKGSNVRTNEVSQNRTFSSKHGRMGLDGKQLNKEWEVGARHALFSRDGTWYENLERFPGALFDPSGYVLFKNEEEYYNDPHIKVGKKTNVRGGIASMPQYVRKNRDHNI